MTTFLNACTHSSNILKERLKEIFKPKANYLSKSSFLLLLNECIDGINDMLSTDLPDLLIAEGFVNQEPQGLLDQQFLNDLEEHIELTVERLDELDEILELTSDKTIFIEFNLVKNTFKIVNQKPNKHSNWIKIDNNH